MGKKSTSTNIGGQAVIEGVMMRGKNMYALAVRTPDSTIAIEKKDIAKKENPLRKTPIFRGVFAFVDSLLIGTKTLTRSAELAGMDEEEDAPPTKFELFLTKLFGDKLNKALIVFSVFLSLIFAGTLFIFLPVWIGSFFKDYVDSWARGIIEGIIKISIFVLYTWLISKLSDMRRVFEYHGAEHKTINCYEGKEALTVENVRKYTRFHKRCGTSFLLIVMLISMIIFTAVRVDSVPLRMLYRLLLLPVIAGFSYEVIRWAGRHDSLIVKIVSFPGIWLQNITTKEPDDSQIEVAIASMNAVLETEGNNEQ